MSKTALITGASAGLGAEFARQLAAAGYDLVIAARRLPRLQALGQEIIEAHEDRQVHCIAVDLSEASGPGEICARVRELDLSIDYLVNNAGYGGPNLVRDADWPVQDGYLRLMMLSVAELCHAFLPGMIERGFGRIINVSSMAGRAQLRGDGHYGPSKAYLIALSQSLDLAVRSHGVNVCALCPGFTHTEFHREGERAELKAATPKFIWYDADTVVREGLRAVEKGRVVYVSGRLYRWLDPIARSALVRWIMRRRAARSQL